MKIAVTISRLRFSTSSLCQYNKCQNKDRYGVFYGANSGQLSTLHGTCCKEHLSSFVEGALRITKKMTKAN